MPLSVPYPRARFVSALEGKDGLPVFAVQFHPESIQWDPQDGTPGAPHPVPAKSAAAVRTAQYLGNFLVDAARNNSHQYPTALDEARDLISQQMTLEFHKATEGGVPYLYPEGAYLFGAAAGGAGH